MARLFNNLKKEEEYILYGIIGIFILGSFMHFIYEWTSRTAIIGSVSPINESIWEHLKLSLIPILLWYSIYYIFNKHINKNGWFLAMLTSFVAMMITIPLLYYFFTGAFGIHSMIVDILIFIIAVILGQLIGLFIYKKCRKFPAYASIIIYAILIIMFMVLTFNPPDLPIFHVFLLLNCVKFI